MIQFVRIRKGRDLNTLNNSLNETKAEKGRLWCSKAVQLLIGQSLLLIKLRHDSDINAEVRGNVWKVDSCYIWFIGSPSSFSP